MDKVGGAQGKLAGGVGCFCGCHDEAKVGSLILLGRGILLGKVSEHVGETLVKVS